MPLTKQTIRLHSEKKHSIRYDGTGSSDDPTIIRGIYVPRALLPKPAPSKLTITLDVEQD